MRLKLIAIPFLFIVSIFLIVYFLSKQPSKPLIKLNLESTKQISSGDTVDEFEEHVFNQLSETKLEEPKRNNVNFVVDSDLITEENAIDNPKLIKALGIIKQKILVDVDAKPLNEHIGRMQFFVSLLPKGLTENQLLEVELLIQDALLETADAGKEISTAIIKLYQYNNLKDELYSSMPYPETEQEYTQLVEATEAFKLQVFDTEMKQLLFPETNQENNDSQSKEEGSFNENLTKEELFAMTVEELGTDDALAIQEMEDQKAEWDKKYHVYNQEKEALLNNPAIADVDKQVLLEHILQRHYPTKEERKMVAIYTNYLNNVQ